jgi:hypothetical protein
MNELQEKLVESLARAAKRLRRAGLPFSLAADLERLAQQVDQPCVVAVVGRVKSGKSSFINALLGDDLAKVGSTETTATINVFRYGSSQNGVSVRCHWRNGSVTEENRAFLDSLQGNDLETLRRADGIDHLEYLLPNPYLTQITLVDTPGTGAVVDEHQNRTAEYLRLEQQLRDRHHHETERLGDEADAIIYLIGETPRVTDQAFLEEFQNITQGRSRALNALGVMAKIDLNPEVIKRREELAEKTATQLRSSLNTVIPVSSGVYRALRDLLAQDALRLKQMIEAFQRVPAPILEEMLSNAELYHDPDLEYPLSLSEREQLRGQLLWRSFVTVVQVMIDSAFNEAKIVSQLHSISGFERLQEKLDNHFVRRGHILRGYRILNDAFSVLRKVQFTYLPEFYNQREVIRSKRERFLAFVARSNPNDPVARELAQFIEEQLAPRTDLQEVLMEIEREIGRIKYELEDYNADFDALQKLAISVNVQYFTSAERSELEALFGLYGLEMAKRLSSSQMKLKFIGERQGYWDARSNLGSVPVVREIAQQASRRYGLLAEQLF